MKNRAKCKLCGDVIESFHRYDFVACKCGEISVDGGDVYYKCAAKDWKNFLRVDDEGNEILVRIGGNEEEPSKPKEAISKPTKKELLDMLEGIIKSYENLPQHAMASFVTNYDLYSSLLLLFSILEED